MEPGSDYLNGNIKGLYLCFFFLRERNGNFAIFIVAPAKWACHQPKLFSFLLFFGFFFLTQEDL